MNRYSNSCGRTGRLKWTTEIAGAVLAGMLLVLAPASGSEVPAYAQETSNPAIDLVFLVDESGSMYDDATEVHARITDLVRGLTSEVDVRVGLVGFGAFVGHFGTTAVGQSHIHTPLVTDPQAFREALDQLVSNGGVEPGFSAVVLGMSDAMHFRPEASVCAVLITDEDADVTPEAPETKADALAALQRRNAVLLAIVDPAHGATADDYGPNPGSLAEATGGAVFNILDFRADPTTVLATVLRTCVRITTGREAPVEPPRSEGPQDTIEETLKSLQERLERLSPTIAALLEQVGENGDKLRELETQSATRAEEVSSLRTTLEELTGRVDELARQRTAVPPELEARLTTLQQGLAQSRQNLSSLQATVAHLTDQQRVFVNQVGDLTSRMRSLEQRVDALPSRVETNISQQFVAFFQKIQTESDQRIMQLEERWGGESGALRRDLASLQAIVADLAQARQTAAARLDDVARRVEALERDVKEHATAATARLDEIARREDELQAQVDGADGEIAALREIVDGLVTENGDLANTIGAVAEHVDELDGRISEVVPDLEARLDELQALGLENQAENRRLVERAATLEQALSMLQGAVTQNAEAIQALRKMADRLAQVKDALREMNEALSARIDELAGRISANEDAIAALQTDIAHLADALNGLRGDLEALAARLRDRLTALEARVDGLEQAFSEAAKAEDVEAALGEIRGQLADLAARQQEIQAQLAQIRALAEGNLEAIAELQPSRERLKEELKREILGELPKAPEVITREQARPDAAFRLAVVALLVSIAAVAIAFLV